MNYAASQNSGRITPKESARGNGSTDMVQQARAGVQHQESGAAVRKGVQGRQPTRLLLDGLTPGYI